MALSTSSMLVRNVTAFCLLKIISSGGADGDAIEGSCGGNVGHIF
jgi:hypothetical protein